MMCSGSYSVYRHTTPNGKMYVGITGRNVKRRWKGGSGYSRQQLFYRAIKKYGWDNIKSEVLLDGLSKEQAELAERIFIGVWGLTNPNLGYNISDGGLSSTLGQHHSKETKQKMSQNHADVSGNKNPMYGTLGDKSPTAKRVVMINKDTNEVIRHFASTMEAYRETSIDSSCIGKCCRGQRKSAGGYRWEYA